jgi:hypothetical protein
MYWLAQLIKHLGYEFNLLSSQSIMGKGMHYSLE